MISAMNYFSETNTEFARVRARASMSVKGPRDPTRYASGGWALIKGERVGPCFSLSGLRIVFIARPLSLTADFYSVSLHKSAYDILCASARKIIRNSSRSPTVPPRPLPRTSPLRARFFNFHPGPAAARPPFSRESSRVRSRIFFSLPLAAAPRRRIISEEISRAVILVRI